LTEWQWYGIWVVTCAAGVAVSLAAEHRSKTGFSAFGKLVAAPSYIAAAWSLGAAGTDHGRVLLAGMALCWAGDFFLVSRSSQRLFIAGLAGFLLGHVAFAVAFALLGLSLPALGWAVVVMLLFAWVVWRWLRPHLSPRLKKPVGLYIAAISAMMATAGATFSISHNWPLIMGAALFVASDLGVARNRFVAPGFVNRVWSLPAYFCAQLLLAASVAV